MEPSIKCISCRTSQGDRSCTYTDFTHNISIDSHENVRLSSMQEILPQPLSNKSQTFVPTGKFGKSKVTHIASFFVPRRRSKKLSCRRVAVCLVIVSLVYLQLSTGIFQRYFLERDFRMEFSYPFDIQDLRGDVENCVFRKGDAGLRNAVNSNYSKVAFLQTADRIQANTSIGLLIIVKSATKNYKKRMAIRKTWGDQQYLKENALMPGFATQLAFICGVPKEEHVISDLFLAEKHFGDIVLAQFHDSYENNTFKTMLAMRFALEHVHSFKFLMIVDDDMYVNLENAVNLLNDISTTHVQAVTSSDSGVSALYPVNQLKEVCPSSANISLEGRPILMGNLIVDAKPFRSLVGQGSKWTISIEDYPFNYFPPYIAGGVTLFDSNTINYLYCGSFYTKHFWIDDVYIGIIAHKLGILLTNNILLDSSYGTFGHNKLSVQLNNMIALHGLECPEQLIELWHSRDIESLDDCYYLKGIL